MSTSVWSGRWTIAMAQRLIGEVEYVPLATSHVVHLSDPKRFIAVGDSIVERKALSKRIGDLTGRWRGLRAEPDVTNPR